MIKRIGLMLVLFCAVCLVSWNNHHYGRSTMRAKARGISMGLKTTTPEYMAHLLWRWFFEFDQSAPQDVFECDANTLGLWLFNDASGAIDEACQASADYDLTVTSGTPGYQKWIEDIWDDFDATAYSVDLTNNVVLDIPNDVGTAAGFLNMADTADFTIWILASSDDEGTTIANGTLFYTNSTGTIWINRSAANTYRFRVIDDNANLRSMTVEAPTRLNGLSLISASYDYDGSHLICVDGICGTAVASNSNTSITANAGHIGYTTDTPWAGRIAALKVEDVATSPADMIAAYDSWNDDSTRAKTMVLTGSSAAGLFEKDGSNYYYNMVPKKQTRQGYEPNTGIQAALYEWGSTNYVLYSTEFDNAVWTNSNSTDTANVAVGYDNVLTADRIDDNDGANAGYLEQQVGGLNDGGKYTATIYTRTGDTNGASGVASTKMELCLGSGVATINDTSIAFVDSNPDTITDSNNGFVSAGFDAGDSITVTNSASNNTTYTIAAGGVAAGTLTLVGGDTVVVEGAGADLTIDYDETFTCTEDSTLTTAWERVSAYKQITKTTATFRIHATDKDAAADTGSIYVWGSQVDRVINMTSTWATGFIPTEGSSVTRIEDQSQVAQTSEDIVDLDDGGFSAWIYTNYSQNTAYVGRANHTGTNEGNTLFISNYTLYLQAKDGTNTTNMPCDANFSAHIGAWTHVAGFWHTTGTTITLDLYVNGDRCRAAGTLDGTWDQSPASDFVKVASRSSGGSREALGGYIRDFHTWDTTVNAALIVSEYEDTCTEIKGSCP